MKFTRQETRNLLGAWLLLSLAFAILLSGVSSILKSPINFLIAFVISLLTAGIGFLLHELMHKYVAQKYGLWAEFRASYNMLFLSILFSLFGFIIAAPGAVFISGRITKEKNGKISLAGPMTNIVLAILFLIPLLFISSNGFFYLFLSYGLLINSLLALFNLIPFGPLDGKKVFAWNKVIYSISVVLALGLFVSRYFI